MRAAANTELLQTLERIGKGAHSRWVEGNSKRATPLIGARSLLKEVDLIAQGCLHSLEVREILGRWGLLGVFDQAICAYDEGGTSTGIPDVGKIREDDVVGLGHRLVKVGEQRKRNLILFCPRLLRKRTVDADRQYLSAKISVLFDAAGNITHLLRAHAGEGQGEKENDGLLLSEIIAEFDVFQTRFGLRFKNKIRSFGANCKCHGGMLAKVDSGAIGITHVPQIVIRLYLSRKSFLHLFAATSPSSGS